jgi:chaperonin cofactor prefoldin
MSEVTERLDRLENHFKVYKTDMQDVKDGLREVKILLGGTDLNGRKGFIKVMELVEEKVDTLEKKQELMQNDLDTIKFWGRGTAGVLFITIGLMLKKLFNL